MNDGEQKFKKWGELNQIDEISCYIFKLCNNFTHKVLGGINNFVKVEKKFIYIYCIRVITCCFDFVKNNNNKNTTIVIIKKNKFEVISTKMSFALFFPASLFLANVKYNPYQKREKKMTENYKEIFFFITKKFKFSFLS